MSMDLQQVVQQKPLLVGKSQAFLEMCEFAQQAGDSDENILILGESGTGKGELARLIHSKMPELPDGRPFVEVNCGCISESLAESTLFGHERYSFTDARTDHLGLVEQAAGGTLFCDEIGTLTPALQIKMLKVVEQGVFRRVGGTRDIAVNTRIIAATHADLSTAVMQGTFREDLHFRLNIIPFEVPPLRKRKEDIPLLVEHFLEQKKRPDKKVDSKAMDLLMEYHWPGNIRELRSMVVRGIFKSRKDEFIRPEHVLPYLTGQREAESKGWALRDYFFVEGTQKLRPYHEFMQAVESEYVAEVLKSTNGNQSQAAEVMDISRGFLRRRIRDLSFTERNPRFVTRRRHR